MPKTKTKQPKVKVEWWTEMIGTYLRFAERTFDGITYFMPENARPLKSIVTFLHEKAIENRIAWTSVTAQHTLDFFLTFASKMEVEGVSIPLSHKWFLIYAAKYKNEIIESIRQMKLQKQVQ